MADKAPLKPGTRQLLWIIAAVVILTVLVVVFSWMTAGGGSSAPGMPAKGSIEEEQVNRSTFQPEQPANRPAVTGASESNSPIITPPKSAPSPVETAPAPSKQEPAPKAEPPKPASKPAPAPAPKSKKVVSPFGVQVGAFANEANARVTRSRLEAKGYRVIFLSRAGKIKVVVVGPQSRQEAEKLRDTLRKKGFPHAFTVPLE
ncbi:MAG: SPOR domain-containing protein [Acidobacteriota bacterium]|jgi:cell division septation protein DedD